MIVGLSSIIYMNQMLLSTSTIIFILLGTLVNLGIMIGIAVMFGNLLKNPELSALSFLIIGGINYSLNKGSETLLHQIFRSDLYYKSESFFLSFGIALILGIIINYSTLEVHSRMDLEL